MTTFVPLSGDHDGAVSAVNIGDWLLNIFKTKKSEKAKVYYKQFMEQFTEADEMKDRSIKDHEQLFYLLLGEVDSVLGFLDDAHKNEEVTLFVTVPDAGHEKEVHKTYLEILKEVEEFFVVLMSIIASRFPSNEAKGRAAGELCAVLRNSHKHAEMRLKLLKSFYNVFPPSFPHRFPIFVVVLEYSAETNQFSSMLPYLRYLNEWMKDWNLPSSTKRQIFLILANELKKLGKNDEAYPYLKRHIQFFQGERAPLLSDGKTVSAAVELAEDSIKLPEIIYFDSILELDAIKYLRQTDHKHLVELLDIFLKGGPNDLQVFAETYPSVFEEHNLNYDQCLNKIRLLTLTSIAAEAREMDLHSTSQALNLSEHDTQEIVVQAIGQGLLDAKIDQMNKSVHVRSAMQREFNRTQWEILGKKLRAWSENVKSFIPAS